MIVPIGLNSAAAFASGKLGVRLDPYLAHNFVVEIDGLLCGGFAQVNGLGATIGVEDRPEGGVNDHVRKVLVGANQPNLVLQKGLTSLDTLWTWFDQTRSGVIVRRNLTVMLLDEQRWPAMWWDVKDALPVSWTGPSFDAENAAIAVERVELVHHGLTRPLTSTIGALAKDGLQRIAK